MYRSNVPTTLHRTPPVPSPHTCVELSTPCPCSCCSRHASSRSRTSVSMPARCGAPHILPTTPPPPASASACGPSLWEAYGPEPQAPLQQLAANRGPGGLAARWRRPWMSPASACSKEA
eukprot:scaffold118502_cov19-Tisochrysis_lutea.AAC.2